MLHRLLAALGLVLSGTLFSAPALAECGGSVQCIGIGLSVSDAQNAHHGGPAPATPTVAFGSQATGTTSASQTIFVEAVTGPGGSMADLGIISISGADAAQFSITGGTCSDTSGPVHGGAGCTIVVAFNPSSTGAKSATLNVPLDPPICGGCITGRTATLTGTGVQPAPVITSALTASGTEGAAFNYQITATNSPTSFTAAPLPAGLTVNASGLISGTPTTAGTTNTTITATNASGTDSETLVITINVPPPVITSANTASGTGGQPFSYQITATNSPTSFGASGLPPGVSVNTGTGLISGTPTAPGTYNATVSATNASGTGSQPVTITIGTATPVITSSGTASGTGGQPFSYQITASNLPTSFGASGLPAGTSVDTNTGLISGTPTVTGTFNATVSATNTAGTGSQPVTITIGTATPVITSPNSANATSGQPFSYQITASNLPASFGASGLPTGLTVDTTTGLISGTPIVATAGTYPITVSATNTAGTGSQTVNLQIAVTAPVITSAATASGNVAQPFSYQITATQFPTSFNATGLPAGLSVNTATGLISGSPAAAGTFNVTVSATNSVGTGSQPVVVTITLLPPVITSPATASGTVMQPFSYQITASNNPTSFGASGLPGGLAVNAGTGLISGTPATAGTFNATVSATNASGTGSQPLAITIGNIGAPVAGPLALFVPFQGAGTIDLASGVSGSFSSVAIASQPANGTVTLNGTVATYTAAAGFSGTDGFTYTASGTGGTSAPAAVTVNVGTPAAPVAAARSVSVPFQTPTAIDLTSSITGVFTGIAVASQPAHGTVSVSGNVVTYTPAAGYFGADSFTYTASGPGGTSQPATVSITVETVPLTAGAAAMTVPLNTPTTLDLAPFITGSGITRVNIVTRPAHGTVAASGTRVTYTPSRDYFGPDSFTYAAVGVTGTSAPATVSVTVTGRPDPTKDAVVTGVLAAQADAAQRFSRAQIANFQGRMESLHRKEDGGGRETTARANPRPGPLPRERENFRESFLHNSYASAAQLPFASEVVSLLTTSSTSLSGLARGATNFWVSGTARFGRRGATGEMEGLEFTTQGVSVGFDRRFSDQLAGGFGLGYARDRTDIGLDGSDSRARGVSAVAYASWQPTRRSFIDALVGIGSLDFKSRRFVAPAGDFARSERDGRQVFASIAAGYEYRENGVLFSPYARLDYSSERLDAATETGAGAYALAYSRQTTPATQGAIGLRAETLHETEFGWANPRARLEYRHSFQGDRKASIAYADLAGTEFAYSTPGVERNAVVLGLGTEFIRRGGLTVGIEYQLVRASSRDHEQAIRLYLSQDLDARGTAAWLTGFTLEPTRPRDFQVDGGFMYDDNVTRSQFSADKLGDSSFSANVRKSHVRQLSRHTRAIVGATLGGEKFKDYNGLSKATASLEGEVQYRSSAAFGAPTLAWFLQGTAEAYESRLRDGHRYSTGLSVRQPITDRLNLFAAYTHTNRAAKGSVFDGRDDSGRVNIDYLLGKDTLYLTGEYRRGDVVGSGRPPAPGNPFPHSHDFDHAALEAPDDAFTSPQYHAYRFRGSSTLTTLGYNMALGPRQSLDFSWRRVQTEPQGRWGIDTLYGTVIFSRYVTNQFFVLYLLSF